MSIATERDSRNTRYHVSPRLNLVDKRPSDEQSADYFEQVLGNRLVALEDSQVLVVPYAKARAQIFAITTNRQVERDGSAWVLSEHERHLLNLVRLANGRPLLVPEVLETGFQAHAMRAKDRASGVRDTVRSLNASIFNDGSGLEALVIDDTEPQLVRLTRSLIIRDQRQMRTPTNPEGNDLPLRDQLERVLQDYLEAHREQAEAYSNYPEVKRAPLPSVEHQEMGREHAARAFLNNQIGLRDIYMISLRLGIHFPFLINTVLPLGDGRRIRYNEFDVSQGSGPPMPLPHVGKALGISPTFYARIFARTMRKLDAAVSGDAQPS